MNYAKPYRKGDNLNNPELIPIFSKYTELHFHMERGCTFDQLRDRLVEIEKDAAEDGVSDLEIFEDEYYGDGYGEHYDNPTRSIHVFGRQLERDRDREERLKKHKKDQENEIESKAQQEERDKKEFERLTKIFNKAEAGLDF